MVHIHAEGPAFFCWIPKLFGKRVISTIHGLDWDREKWRGSVASKFIRGGEKNAVKYADEIIVLSKDVQKYFLETYGRETHFIPNGVNRPEVREAKLITDHFGLEKDSYILFLGRLVPEKGIRYLVEAFKNVKTDKKLVIAGGSSDTDSFMEELKELAKGDNRILFTGFVQGAMLDELYSNAYIYTLPSDLEGMPLSLLEAMSYGKHSLTQDELAKCLGVSKRTVVQNFSQLHSCFLAVDSFDGIGQLAQFAAAMEVHIRCISIDTVAHAAAFVFHTEVLNLVSMLLQCLTQFEYIRLAAAVSVQKFIQNQRPHVKFLLILCSISLPLFR